MTNMTTDEVKRLARNIFAQLTGEELEDVRPVNAIRWEKPIEDLSDLWFDDLGGYDFEVEFGGVTYQCQAWRSVQSDEGAVRQPMMAVRIDGWIAVTFATPIYY